MLGQEEPKHPLMGVLDFSKIDFRSYGRNYYDFQEGSLFFMAPNQVIGMEDPDETHDAYGWALVFHPELLRGTALGAKMKDYNFFSYNVHEALHLSDKKNTGKSPAEYRNLN